MKFTPQDYDYLLGNKFSNGYDFKLENNPLYSRIDRILDITRGGKVIHVGCCDHLPLIDSKIREGKWLHGLLENNCEDVLGVDIDRKAVEYVNSNNLSKKNVLLADVTNFDFSEYNICGYDFVLLGEILEHVDNPVIFLQNLKANLLGYGFKGKIIITVPNVYFLFKSCYSKRIEKINSDHRYWFSPYTISKVMVRAGIYPEELFFADYLTGINGNNRFLNKFFLIYYKLFGSPSSFKSFEGENLIAIGSLKEIQS